MIVKIGNKFTDSNDEPIMIIVDDQEKNCIGNMGEQTKFCVFPEGSATVDMQNFMKDEKQLQDIYFKGANHENK